MSVFPAGLLRLGWASGIDAAGEGEGEAALAAFRRAARLDILWT